MAAPVEISVCASHEVHHAPDVAAVQQKQWRSRAALASVTDQIEHFLEQAGFDRAPWLAVGFGLGIVLWFRLDTQWHWLGLIALGVGAALAAMVLMERDGRWPFMRQAIMAMAAMAAVGCATVWAKSALMGTPPIAHAMAPVLIAKVLERDDQPAENKVRLVLATRVPQTGEAIRVRVSLPLRQDLPGVTEGAIVRLRARLMPPNPPKLPGGYDFARAAWFDGIAATGTVLGPVTVVQPAQGGQWLARLQHSLSDHVRARVAGSPGGIAAAFASGDRGGISLADEQAMRDSGLTHLLSVSGLHVSAVIAGTYVIAIRLLALVPAVALRVRLPVLASGIGGIVGIGYTLLTGAQVPTVRACLGALLVLAALAFGRQPLSMRMLAMVAMLVMVLWPESLVGPSFQMSFGSVMAIIAVHDCAPARAFLAPRPEGRLWRMGRHLFMILLTGMVIELALMPIALFYFHRAGIYGSMANVIAIPLTTFVSMPMIALALVLDMFGAGAPAWWLSGKSLQLLLDLAHTTASIPHAVSLLPTMGAGRYALFLAGMLWLALWHGKARLLGLVPAVLAAFSLAGLGPPDVLITGDGRNLGIITQPQSGGPTFAQPAFTQPALLILREGRSSYTSDAMLEAAGMSGAVARLTDWPGAQCNKDFCLVSLARGGRIWRLLIARREVNVAPAELARACAGVDIVVAPNKIYGPCHPAMIKADRTMLMRTGGLALDLDSRTVRTVAQDQGSHPWWRAPHRLPRRQAE